MQGRVIHRQADVGESVSELEESARVMYVSIY